MSKLIICPICKKHEFSTNTSEHNICPNCGWQHDILSEENQFEISEPNGLSLMDFKLRYEYYVEQKSDYSWSKDKFPQLPQIEPILCPVCNKYHFEELTIEDISCGITPSEVECTLCGWHYDENQQNNPDLENGANKLSLNEYKKWYENKLKENPEYSYFEEKIDNYEPTPHICPVCGKYEFGDISSHDVCSFCGWEDDNLMEDEPDKWAGCSNDLCLNDYIERYKSFLKVKSNYKFEKDGILKQKNFKNPKE